MSDLYQEAIEHTALVLGIDIIELSMPTIFDIVEEALHAPPPAPWVEKFDDLASVSYFYNPSTNQTSYDNPALLDPLLVSNIAHARNVHVTVDSEMDAVDVEKEDDYIEHILDRRLDRTTVTKGKKQQMKYEYKVHWHGTSSNEDEWFLGESMTEAYCQELIRQYDLQQEERRHRRPKKRRPMSQPSQPMSQLPHPMSHQPPINRKKAKNISRMKHLLKEKDLHISHLIAAIDDIQYDNTALHRSMELTMKRKEISFDNDSIAGRQEKEDRRKQQNVFQLLKDSNELKKHALKLLRRANPKQSGSEMEVLQWLQSIGFQRYHQNFVQAECFSLSIVWQIETEKELQEINIPRFPAKALMQHIQELKYHRFSSTEQTEDLTQMMQQLELEKQQMELEKQQILMVEKNKEIERLKEQLKGETKVEPKIEAKHPAVIKAIEQIKAGEQEIYLGNNQISDISTLARALPNSQVQTIDLENNQINDISALARALANSQVQRIDLNGNQISDISALATLPSSQVQEILLHSNQISDISALAAALPNSQVQKIWLGNNEISDISALAAALPNSQVQTILLDKNQINDISALARALPNSQVQRIDLDNNQISDISALARALPNSQLQRILLDGNQISDISALAAALPNSQVQGIWLHDNQISEEDKATLKNLKNKKDEDIDIYL